MVPVTAEQKSEPLLNRFKSVSIHGYSIIPHRNLKSTVRWADDLLVKTHNMASILKALKVDEAEGFEKINADIIKPAADIIYSNLTDCFNLALSVSRVPDGWRTMKAMPIQK